MYGVATQNGVGLGVGNIPTLTSLAYPQMLNAIVLGAFSGGAPGWLYDDSNMSTLFQDAAGTTPVTALEQPVGLQLDLSQGLGRVAELITPVANQTFSSNTGYWNLNSSVTIANNALTFTASGDTFGASHNSICTPGSVYQITYTIGTLSSGGFQIECGGNVTQVRSAVGTYVETILCGSTGSGRIYLWSVGASTTGTITSISVRIAGNHRYQTTSANRPTWSARYNLLLATASLSTQSVTTVATNYVLYFTGSGTVTLSGTSTGTLSAGSNTITCTAGTLTLTVSGSVLTADLRPANQAVGLLPQYQAVVTASNYDSVGFPAGLRWNGSNSWMQNASVDFSGTNKLSVFVGVRKQSDAAGTSVVVELSTSLLSNNGSFYLNAPSGAATNDYAADAKGTTENYVSATPYLVPDTRTMILAADIGAPSIALYVNGVVKTSNTTTMGTGNFGNYPAYFGARAGSSRFFNGLTFSNIAIGIALSASQIAAFEAWTNSRTKAYA